MMSRMRENCKSGSVMGDRLPLTRKKERCSRVVFSTIIIMIKVKNIFYKNAIPILLGSVILSSGCSKAEIDTHEYSQTTIQNEQENDLLGLYYFDFADTKTVSNSPVGMECLKKNDAVVKYEAYGLAYHAIEQVDDSFQNIYNLSPEDKYKLLFESDFDVEASLNNLESSDSTISNQAKIELIAAKEYYKTWLKYNSDIVLDVEENLLNQYYKKGDTLEIKSLIDSNNSKISLIPVETVPFDAYDALVKFESYNLAYRGIEEVDDSFEGKFSFSDEERYQLIGGDFDVVACLNELKDSNDLEIAQKLEAAKEYYSKWIDLNSEIVLDYCEKTLLK